MSAVGILGALLVGTSLAVVAIVVASRRHARIRLPEDLVPPGSAPGRDEAGSFVRAAERAISRSSIPQRLALELPRAGIEFSVERFTLLAITGAVTVGLLVTLVSKALLAGLVAAAGALIATRLVVRHRAARWTDRFDDQLPDALDLLAGSLEAGTSLAQAMGLVAADGRPPLAGVFERILADTRLGQSLVDAMETAAVRVGSSEFAWCVRAVRIQQEFGASLADVLRTLGEFMRWRQELRRDVRALTAEGRISAYILVSLPFLVGFFLLIVNPSYLALLVTTPLGWGMTIFASVLMVVGSIWMRRIVKVEV
ncbi:MAG: type II secretion system F family protein [Actinomycetota bacterium]